MINTIITEESWMKVENNIPGYGRLNISRVNYGMNVLIASDHKGFRHILLPLDKIDSAIKDNKSRGIVVFGRDLQIDEQPNQPFLDVWCIQKDNNNLFNIIANDIVNKIQIGESPVEAVSVTLNNWRKFWLKGLKPILSENEIKGLFGELWFLYTWLLPKGKEQIMNWFGPSGNKYDFESTTFSVEVKTTSSLAGHIHKINGLSQLEIPSNGLLYLFSLIIRNDKKSNYNIPLLVRDIKDILSSNITLLYQFENKLIEAGYLSEYEAEYEDFRFNIVDERMYIVDEEFPKLTANDLVKGIPKGVQNIQYDINLDNCHNFHMCNSPKDWEVECKL
ncbi:PD-(D/E)XK motif protein [Priestia aryabhattai]|uniref:PD-(D/E)XK motif protein n=1 Tax=Priestia aryabhattai TaxID=412384 RepID=UPI000C070169|nr:PD-(D/E)XK motif protein [Priestia aryabhattai]